MTRQFLSIITQAGREKIAAASVTGEKVLFSLMAVGDGDGGPVELRDSQDGLANEHYRTQLNSLKIQDNQKNIISAEAIIPPEIGGFTIREAALYDEDGVCMAVARVPETYKPALAEGSGRFTVLRIWLIVSSTENIEMIVDPGIVLATVEDVINAGNAVKDYADDQLSDHVSSRNHPDATLDEKGFTRLSNATDSDSQSRAATPSAVKAAIAQAIRGAWELDNPVGTTRFFSQNLNPNERWPWSEWVYTGENKSIRVGKADGSNVGLTAGSDSVTLSRDNLPKVQIDVSGETSEKEEQRLQTEDGGAHDHDGVPSREDPWEIGGDIRQLFNPARTGKTDESPAHKHNVVIPEHKHNVSGKTANLGEGTSFSVVEAHTLLMCWARVA